MRLDKAGNLVGWVAVCVTVGCGGTVTEIDPEADGSGGSSATGSGSGGSGGGETTGTTATTRSSGSSTSRAASSSASSGSGGTGGDTSVTSAATSSGSGTRTVTSTSTGAGGVTSAVTVTTVGTTTGAGGGAFGGAVTVTGAGGSSVVTGGGGSGGYPNVDIPDDCFSDYRYQGSNWCEMSFECPATWVYAYCNASSNDVWSCECDTDRYYSSYTLTGVEDSVACPLTASLCMNPDQVDFTGPEECSPVYQERQSNYCSMEVECTQSQQINDYIVAERNDWQWIYCYGSGSGYQCECDTRDGNINLTIEDASNSSTICPDMLELCNTGDLQAEGPKTCEPRSQFSQQGYCSADQQCSQEASVDGMSVLVNSYISTECHEQSAGEWDCNCYTAPGSTSFSISSSDAWAACSEASSACAVAAGAE